MAAMPRPSIKATKIAYKILGVPANFQSKKDRKQRKINRRLNFEEVTFVR